jgi:hypothetical protein
MSAITLPPPAGLWTTRLNLRLDRACATAIGRFATTIWSTKTTAHDLQCPCGTNAVQMDGSEQSTLRMLCRQRLT